VLAVGVVILLFSGSAFAAEGGPQPALKPVTAEGKMVLSSSDRCPVCAMFPARRPESAAALTLSSGVTYYFCSNSCLLRSWLRPAVYLGKTQKEIKHIVVRDYFSGENIDGRTATWIAGSDVVGPMGPAIITLGDAGQVQSFKRRHGARILFTFEQLNDALWQQISSRTLPSSGSE